MGKDDSKRVTLSNGSRIEAKESSGEPLRGINPPLEREYLFLGGPSNGRRIKVPDNTPVYYVEEFPEQYHVGTDLKPPTVVQWRYFLTGINKSPVYICEGIDGDEMCQMLVDDYGTAHERGKSIDLLRETVHRLMHLLSQETRRSARGPSLAAEQALLLAESVMKKTLDA